MSYTGAYYECDHLLIGYFGCVTYVVTVSSQSSYEVMKAT